MFSVGILFFSPDGTKVYAAVGSSKNATVAYNVSNGDILWTAKMGEEGIEGIERVLAGPALSPDGKVLYTMIKQGVQALDAGKQAILYTYWMTSAHMPVCLSVWAY